MKNQQTGQETSFRRQGSATGDEQGSPRGEPRSSIFGVKRPRSVPGTQDDSLNMPSDEKMFALLKTSLLLPAAPRLQELRPTQDADDAVDTNEVTRPSPSALDTTPAWQDAHDGYQNGGTGRSQQSSGARESLLPRLLARDEIGNQRKSLATCEYVNEDLRLDARLQVLDNNHLLREADENHRLNAL